MAVTVVPAAVPVAPPPPSINLNLPGRLRVVEVLAVLKISKSCFWDGVNTGRYPKPDYHAGKIPFWKHSTILSVIEHGEGVAQ